MKTNQARRVIRTIILFIENISIGMLWAIALTSLVIAIWQEMTR